jgi:hypothetical protein
LNVFNTLPHLLERVQVGILGPVVTRVRHGLGWTATLACLVVAALLALSSPPADRPGALLRGLGTVALVALVGAYPAVLLDERGVVVRNPWRTWRIGWSAVDDVGFGWALEVRTRGSDGAGRVVRALAAPGPARMRSLYDVHLTAGGVLERDAARSAGPGTAPAVVAVLQARERWRRTAAAAVPARSGWSPGGLGLTLAAAVLLAAGVRLA